MTGLLVDLFAGGGGASLGIERATGRPVDLAVNHWREALAVHEANHPRTRHLHCDVWEVDPLEATGGRPVRLLWASPDCTYHSKARGGKPHRSRRFAERRRALATVVIRWARAVRPRVIAIENVEEFVHWGPLDARGRPCRQRRGRYFRRWVRQLEAAGYSVDWCLLSACDYGAPTTRRRLFVVARRDGAQVRWPEPTHGPGLAPYRTAAEIIDWSLPCPSIFDRRRPLAEATLMRIAKGIQRYVIGDPRPFIVRPGHASPRAGTGYTMRGQRLDQPLSTVTSLCDYALVVPMLSKYHGGCDRSSTRSHRIDEPVRTVDTQPRFALCCAFLARHWGGMVGKRLDSPYPTVTSRGSQDELCAAMLARAPAEPRPELRAFIMRYYGSGGQLSSCRAPLPTATSKARMGLVVVTIDGEPWQIVDIGMRMLTPRELARAQGFPDDYQLEITVPRSAGAAEVDPRPLPKADQYALIGNSVCPPVAEAIARANG